MSAEVQHEELRGTGRATRLGLWLIVLTNVALAVLVAVAVTWLATRPGLRARIDLTASGINTLDESTRRLLENLPEETEIRIDSFFRPLDEPLTGIGLGVQETMTHILRLAEEFRPDRVELEDHPLTPDPATQADVEARLRELGIPGQLNVVVVSSGERKEVLRLLGDIAEIDLGNPIRRAGQYKPPSLQAFRGEEALLEALLKVTQGATPKALFSWGNGERDLYGDSEYELGLLESALRADGFTCERWVPDEDGSLPADCAVLAVIAPRDPFTEDELDWIRAYLDGGGRMIAVPNEEDPGGPGSLAALLAEYGIEVGRGFVCVPVVDPATGQSMVGNERVAGLTVRASQMAIEHPITRPLRMSDRRVRLLGSHPLDRGQPPTRGALLDLLASGPDSWEDLPDAEGKYDWRPEEGEPIGPFRLAMTSVFPPKTAGPVVSIEGTVRERPEGRVFAMGSAIAFTNSLHQFNRDLLLNAFNWAAGREYRVNVSPRDPDLRRIDVQRGGALVTLNRVAVLGLPGLCLVLGLFIAWRRRR